MKKIKLLTPIIGTALLTATAIPLAACSKPAVEPIDREIQIDSSIANTVLSSFIFPYLFNVHACLFVYYLDYFIYAYGFIHDCFRVS